MFDQPISQPFAHAHCQALAPERATANSGGTLVFAPDAPAPPCDAENPGGQTTGP